MEQLNLYQVFYEVAKCGNLSAAANKLYVSQPAVSKSIARLEAELSTILFYRSSRGVRLTPEGEILYKYAENALLSLHNGEALLKSLAEKGISRLSIGASTTLCKYVLLPLLKGFLDDNPKVKLSISCLPTLDTIFMLKENKLDLGLVGVDENLIKEFEPVSFLPLKTIEDIFVASPSYRDRTDLSSESELMKHASFILLNKENISRKHIDHFLGTQLLSPENIMEVNHMDLAIDFARAGLGIACVISDFVREELKNGSLVEIRLNGRIPRRRIGFALPPHQKTGNAADSLIAHYQQRL